MPFNPINYGNIAAQGENILAARQRRDPNSMQNQLLAAKLRNAQNPGNIVDVGKTNPRDFTAESIQEARRTGDMSKLVRYQAPRKPYRVHVGDAHEWYVDNAETGQPMFLKRVPIELGPDQTGDYFKLKGNQVGVGQGLAEQGVDLSIPSDQGLGNQVPLQSAAERAGAVKAAQDQAALDVEESSQKEIKKQSMREADAINAKVLIDDMLAPRKDGGGIYATYAYGRSNVIMPDILKKQEWIDAEAKRNQLVSMLQLENVAKLKGTGPITEPEQVLRQAMTVLENPLISPELAERELKRVRVMFSRWEKEANRLQGKEQSTSGNLTSAEQTELKQLQAEKAAGKF